MNKLATLIGALSREDLKLVKKDLDKGNIRKLIEKKLDESKKFEEGFCPVCGMTVRRDSCFYLEFGKEVRKRAYFDELDCLNYFIHKLK